MRRTGALRGCAGKGASSEDAASAKKRTRSEDANAEAVEEQRVAQLDTRPKHQHRLAAFYGDLNARAVQHNFDDKCAAVARRCFRTAKPRG